MTQTDLLQEIGWEIEKIDTTRRATAIAKVANKYYGCTPESDAEMIELCEKLIESSYSQFCVATLWFKRRKELLNIEYFSSVEDWLYTHIDGWGRCDQFCYRILNPFVYKYRDLYKNVLGWTKSEKVYVRRAAPVSLISIGGAPRVRYDVERVLSVVSLLIEDEHIHVQKAIGWLLKYAYLSYPTAILDYLRQNVSVLSRTAYRYALVKVPDNIRTEMMLL